MSTIAPELESLLKNPISTPHHPPHCSQSDFSKIIVSGNLIMSLAHLNPFVTQCPNVPSKERRLGSPPSLPTPSSPTITFMPNFFQFPQTQPCSLSLQSLFICSSVYLECSPLPFTWLMPNYLSDFKVGMTSSRKPPLILKTSFCALRLPCSSLYSTLLWLPVHISFSH